MRNWGGGVRYSYEWMISSVMDLFIYNMKLLCSIFYISKFYIIFLLVNYIIYHKSIIIIIIINDYPPPPQQFFRS